MVAIARALMSRPRLLLLDEPSLGLAPLMVARIMGRIVALRAPAAPCWWSSRTRALALDIADRGYVLENGRITFSGQAAELLGNAAVQDAYLGGSGAGENTMEQRIRAKKLAIRATAGLNHR